MLMFLTIIYYINIKRFCVTKTYFTIIYSH